MITQTNTQTIGNLTSGTGGSTTGGNVVIGNPNSINYSSPVLSPSSNSSSSATGGAGGAGGQGGVGIGIGGQGGSVKDSGNSAVIGSGNSNVKKTVFYPSPEPMMVWTSNSGK